MSSLTRINNAFKFTKLIIKMCRCQNHYYHSKVLIIDSVGDLTVQQITGSQRYAALTELAGERTDFRFVQQNDGILLTRSTVGCWLDPASSGEMQGI